ncbi:MAG: chemotaxis protein CheB [Thermoleophilia bacterium]|nr:chemotaxis protein CheB [Thermoleophilia bacterium]
MSSNLVAIGASWGGLDALRTILHGLPPSLDAAVVVAQHRSPESHRTAFRDLLGAATSLRVCEAGDKDELRPGTVYLAPPDYHLLVDQGGLSLSTDAPVFYARPSIDVLLESAAESYRERCIGLILTGANADGARGLARVVALGGTAIVQDPAEAIREEMPRAALAAVPSARVGKMGEIASLLVELCGSAKVSA